jgi:hypothetical protein
VTDQECGCTFVEQRASQGYLKNQPPRLDSDQALIARAVRRGLGEAGELVSLTGAEGEHGAVYVGRLTQ